MKKQNLILSAALAAVFSASTAFAEAQVTGKIVHESAKFTTSGTTIGAAAAHGKDVFKQETSARIFIDGDASENATFHVELQAFKDGKAGTNYDSNESYTQRDALREAYVDTEMTDWSIRAGKQQVVWGTADGMKLLDTINPTDYSEMAQNQMEDSRIPVWMINAETETKDGGSLQVIVSQSKGNVIPGINANGDNGHTYIMKGVDTMTGSVNGFTNIAKDFGSISGVFNGFTTHVDADISSSVTAGVVNPYGALEDRKKSWIDKTGPFAGFTVQAMTAFMNAGAAPGVVAGMTGNGTAFDAAGMSFEASETGYYDYLKGYFGNADMSGMDVFGLATTLASTSTNLITDGTVNLFDSTVAPTAAFGYVNSTALGTFEDFIGMTTKWRVEDSLETSNPNIGLRQKGSTAAGLNYSLALLKHRDSNPSVKLSWENQAGVALNHKFTDIDPTASVVNLGSLEYVDGTDFTSVIEAGTAGTVASASNMAQLVFTQYRPEILSLGAAFDTSIETKDLGPVVLRGEFLLDKDVETPIVDRAKMGMGDLAGSLTMQKGDRFSYVLGADITAMTNMMISAQFIQQRNLDYVDTTGSCAIANCGIYTGDMATMHISNNMNKAEENKEFYSLFFSKPFGASGEHRWNNITMFEENGGKWNRLDAEFSIDDDTQATVEYNKYWGDENTQFGQLEKSSNIQVGVKYSF